MVSPGDYAAEWFQLVPLSALFNLPGVMTELSKKAQDDSTSFSDFVDLEQRALAIRMFEMRLIPGLLQTPAYARAVNQIPGLALTPDELERLVGIRMTRQRILDRDRPPALHAIVEEAVLCRRIGDDATMHEQLMALARPRPNVNGQVLPFSAGPHRATTGPLILLRLPDEPDVAYADSWRGGQLIDTPAEILDAQQTFEQLAGLALPPDLSAEMIQAYAEER